VNANARYLGPVKDFNSVKTGKDCVATAYKHGIQVEFEDGKKARIVLDAEQALIIARGIILNYARDYEGLCYRLDKEIQKLILEFASDEIIFGETS